MGMRERQTEKRDDRRDWEASVYEEEARGGRKREAATNSQHKQQERERGEETARTALAVD